MSRTWLIACVARYMTERLSSRSLSQPPATSGAWRTREPSPTGMLRRIAERSSGLAGPSMSTRAVRSRSRSLGGALVEEHHRLAELEPVARAERRLVDRLAVDERAVGRAEVDDPVRVVDRPDLGVPAGDLGIVEPDRVRACPDPGPWAWTSARTAYPGRPLG